MAAKNESGSRAPESAREERAWRPAVDVYEDASGITLLADLPGVPKDRLSVRVEANRLVIEGEASLDLPQDWQPTYTEFDRTRYRRVFTLSRDLDAERSSADLRNGVLRLHIPKAAAAKPKRIEIKVA
jgi:HSP20 family molecular chaperone IbpA